MAQVQCPNGHFYEEAAHSKCPYCPIPGLDVKGTLPALDATRATSGSDTHTVPPTQPVAQNARVSEPVFSRAVDEDVTVPWYPKSASGEAASQQVSRPIVGWLVCVAGPDFGRDYRVFAQRNFIGRSASMDISISGDAKISRERHAEIVYDPKGNVFLLMPGAAHGLCYRNGSLVTNAARLEHYDEIELGDTTLCFVAFCSERFQWQL
jgi:hypothetical protein